MSWAPASPTNARPVRWWALVLAALTFCILIGLGTWQVQRLHWKEGLIAMVAERMKAAPLPLAEIKTKFAASGDVDYWPVIATGTFLHGGERAFFATWEGQSGFNVYTPMQLADSRIVFVNRGFVPYDLKDPSKRAAGQIEGVVTVAGLARNPLTEKPSSLVPDNDPARNIFYWKDRDAMAASAGLPEGAKVLPIFIDANNNPNPGGLPVGGVTLLDFPNNHLQYAVTWYGLAAALAGVAGVSLWQRLRRK